jgi:hypothetical protein
MIGERGRLYVYIHIHVYVSLTDLLAQNSPVEFLLDALKCDVEFHLCQFPYPIPSVRLAYVHICVLTYMCLYICICTYAHIYEDNDMEGKDSD